MTAAWRSMGRTAKTTQLETQRACSWFSGKKVQEEYERQTAAARKAAERKVGRAVVTRAEMLEMLTRAAQRTDKLINGDGEGIQAADEKSLPSLMMALVSVADRLSKLEDWDKQKPAGISASFFFDLRGASPEVRRSRLRELTTSGGQVVETTGQKVGEE